MLDTAASGFWAQLKSQAKRLFADKDTAAEASGGRLPLSIAKARQLLRNHHLSSILPYESYDPETDFFYNGDSFGYVLELSPLMGAGDEVARILSGILSENTPKDTGLQFIFYASPQVGERLSTWARVRQSFKPMATDYESDPASRANKRGRGIFRELARRRVEYLRQGAYQSLFTDQPMLVRDCRLFLSVNLPLPLPTDAEETINNASRLRDSMIGALQTLGLGPQGMSGQYLVSVLDELINPNFSDGLKRDVLQWDEHRLLREQVVRGGTRIAVNRDSLTINDTEVRAYSVQQYPREWGIWSMGELFGDFYQNALRMPCPFIFSVNIFIPDQIGAKNVAKLKSARATQATTTPMGRYVPSWHEKKEEWDFVTKKLDEGNTLCRVAHSLITFNRLGEGSQVINSVRSIFRAKGWEIYLDRFIQLQAFLTCLPFTLGVNFARDLEKMKRMRTMLTWTAANTLPVVSEWRGSRHPFLQLIGRRGQIFWIDPFDNDQGNYNVAVAATSGAGKSFFVQEMAFSLRGTGGQVWIIDSGRSYERLCKLVGGEYLQFTPDNNIILNPFTHITDWAENGLTMLKPLVGQMASPSQPLSDYQNSVLERALKTAWDDKGNQATITDVARYLASEDDQRVRDLAVQLFPYTSKGMYGRYFEGEANLDFKNDFIVLELGELNNKRDLQSVVLMMLMMQVAQSMYLGDRMRRKMCIIDEAWRLMSGGNAGTFIEEGYRVARKHGGSFVTITQGVNDYYKSDTTRAALENADWMFLLRQKQESIDQLAKSDRLSMDESMRRALKSVTTEQGKYSEVLINGPRGWTIGRLIVDPFSEKLYSTKAQEFEQIEIMMQKGASLIEAVEKLVEGSKR